MSDVIGRGVIEVSADSRQLNAAINDARRSIASLGEANKAASDKASASIDRYIKRLEVQQKTAGMSARETELYKLALRGASDEQLRAANSALRLTEAHQRGAELGDRLRTGLLALGAAAATSLVATAVTFDRLIKKAGDFKDVAEKTGDSAEGFASLALAAGTAGTEMESVSAFSIRLTKSLTGVDDESKAAGAAIKALGLDLEKFKELKPSDQIEAVAKALASFEDGQGKTAVMEALAKGASQLLPFLKELGEEGGRQNILTKEQIDLADEYADTQARLATQISLHAQAIATDALPAVLEFQKVIVGIAKDQEFAATASDLLKGSIGAAITVFQTVAVVASDVGFVFKGVGREIAAIAAQLAALSSGNMEGFHAISDAVKEDAARARAELDRFQSRIMSIGQPSPAADPANYGNEGRGVPAPGQGKPEKKKLVFDGAAKKEKKGKEVAEVELLAPAAKEYAAAIEKMNASVIAAEKSTGDLNAAQSALYDLMRSPLWEQMPETWRETAVAEASMASAAIEAAAAQKRLNDLIDDTPTAQIEKAQQDMLLLRDALESGTISAEQFTEAAQARLGTLGGEVKQVASTIDTVITNAFQGMADTIADFVLTGKASFGDLVNAMIRDLIRLEIQTQMTTAWKNMGGFSGLFGSIGSLFGGAGGAAASSSIGTGASLGFAGILGSANGNAFSGVPSLSAYSGSVVDRPTLFPFARGAGLMGEAGPEGIFPLKRGRDGKLGVSAEGAGGSTNVTINVDASGSRMSGDGGQAAELGRRIETAVRGVLMAEKRPGGMLSAA